MRFAVVSSLLLGAAAAQQIFEAANFNATEELLHLGVDVNEIPALSGYVEKRSLDKFACAAAVSV